jgi:FKBP-type peptidyl-prolyl cis-trans isomerase
MAKATKVQSDDKCDKEHDKSESKNEDDEPTKDELFDMLDNAKEYYIKRRECKSLRNKLKALKHAFDELNASHESLKEDHEKLGKAHKKLEKAHSSLLNEQNEKKHVGTCEVGLTYDIIEESFYKSIIVGSTNPSYSTPLLVYLVVMGSLVMLH